MKLQRKTLIDCKEVNVVYEDDSNNYYIVVKDEVIAIFHNVENNNFELFKETDNA